MIPPLRILYAVQGTGNGHVARARALIPRLLAHPQVDLTVWLSGTESEVPLPFEPDCRLAGLSLQYCNGALSYWRTARANRWGAFLRDVWRAPIRGFDLIVNDFEPVTAWAARMRGVPVLEVSHQAGVRHPASPRPAKVQPVMEALLRWFAPSRQSIGLHFAEHGTDVLPPVIRDEIRVLPQQPDGTVLVYLPAYRPHELLQAFAGAPVPVVAFTKGAFSPRSDGATRVEPIAYDRFLSVFQRASSVLCSAGFELSAEALHHGKRLALIPIRGQYEQACNAAAAASLGVTVAFSLEEMRSRLTAWLASPIPAPRCYPDVATLLVDRIVIAAREARSTKAMTHSVQHGHPTTVQIGDRV